MGYKPKHAKPASLADATRVSRHELFAINGPGKGRHAAIATAVAAADATVPEREDETVIRERGTAHGGHDETMVPERSASLPVRGTRAAKAA